MKRKIIAEMLLIFLWVSLMALIVHFLPQINRINDNVTWQFIIVAVAIIYAFWLPIFILMSIYSIAKLKNTEETKCN
jgi:uncharacterized membrane protein YqjE